MSASPAKSHSSDAVRIAFVYLMITILCAVFGAIYEAFSFGVYVIGMQYAFLFPLIGGTLPALSFALRETSLPSPLALQLWHFGISAFTVGSLFSGALAIYGTASRLTVVYWAVGGACLALSVLAGLLQAKLSPRNVAA